MKRQELPILTVIVQVSQYVIKLIAIWIFFRGHQEPGGGFIAGVMVLAAVALQGLAFGSGSAHNVLPITATRLMGLGLLIALAAVVGPLFIGQAPLQSAFDYFYIPLLGKTELSTAAIFDTGVFLVVVGAGKAILLRIAAAKQHEEGDAADLAVRGEGR